MKIAVTGGAGFIGSAVIRQYIDHTEHQVINIDALTYAGNLETLKDLAAHPNYHFEQIDIRDRMALTALFEQHQPDAVMHLAAESHVDRSIDDPTLFIETNVNGTMNLLEVSRHYWQSLEPVRRERFRFLHVSTDEVYGDLKQEGLFSEESPYNPSSPYASSKASSDHQVRAWQRPYGFPALITNCSNNYGMYQYPEKLIPLMILNAIEGKKLPVYGNGGQVRDWLFVEDHADALRLVMQKGKIGDTYNIGGHNEKTNLDVVKKICRILDQRFSENSPHESLIEFVADRPGHDLRYAIDAGKIGRELGWTPRETFESGIAKTVDWYLSNRDWCQLVQEKKYHRQRLGLGSV